jgi:hypothetical protein
LRFENGSPGPRRASDGTRPKPQATKPAARPHESSEERILRERDPKLSLSNASPHPHQQKEEDRFGIVELLKERSWETTPTAPVQDRATSGAPAIPGGAVEENPTRE